LHGAHVRHGAAVQNLAVLIKVAVILSFVTIACLRLNLPPPVASRSFPYAAFGVSLVWISFSYSGWNAAIYIGGEIRDPERNLPLSLLLGTGLVTVLYLALNAVFVYAAPVADLAGKLEIGRIAAKEIGGPSLANAVSALVALVLVSSVSSMVMAGPRVYARMAADGYLPRWLAMAEGPPRAATALQCALALAMLWTSTFDSLLTYIGFTLGLSTAATVVGLMVLRVREGRQLIVPGWPWVPVLFLLGVLAMAGFTIWQRPRESVFGFATMAIGWVAWRVTESRRGR
jgi:APA family basic amino acid/polyamine antiporter